jgi:hypothetical protein
MVDWVTLKDLAIPLHGAMFDVLNYFYKVPLAEYNLAKLKWRDNKNKVCDSLEKKLSKDSNLFKKAREVIDPYPDTETLFQKYDGKVMTLVNMFNPDDSKCAQISKLHMRTELKNYLPWVTMGLNCGTIKHEKQILANSPMIGGVHLFPMGSDKFENIAKMVKVLPPKYEIVIIKDFYSTFDYQQFPTLLKVIDDHYKSGAGATGVKIKVNTNKDWLDTRNFKGKLLAEYQEMMYSLAMYQRNGLDTVNFVSGAFSIWDRKNLEEIFDKLPTTKRWLGEDYELSLRSFCNGRSVRYDDRFEVLAKHSPRTWTRFLKGQQRGWVEALMTVSNDLFFEPAKYVLKEGVKSITFRKNTNEEFKSRFSPTKSLRNVQMLYEFYGMNYFNQCLMYFPKMLGAAVLGVSMLNNVDWLFKTNIFPESLLGISTYKQTSLYYMGALSTLAGYHLIRSDLKNKKKRIFSTATYPFFMFTHQVQSYFPGGMAYLKNFAKRNLFGKKSHNRIEEFVDAHTLIYPKSILNPEKYRLELNESNDTSFDHKKGSKTLFEKKSEEIAGLINPMLKKKVFSKKLKKADLENLLDSAEKFTNYFYKTDYEMDLMIALVDKKYSSSMKLKFDENMIDPFQDHKFYGVFNLSSKELAIYDMHDFTRLLGKQLAIEEEGIVFNPQLSFKQTGYVIPINDKENICLYHIQEFKEDIDSGNRNNMLGSEVYCVKYSYSKKLDSFKLDHKPVPLVISQKYNNISFENLYDLKDLELYEPVDEEEHEAEIKTQAEIGGKNKNFLQKMKKVLNKEKNPLQYSSIIFSYTEEDFVAFDDILFLYDNLDPYP